MISKPQRMHLTSFLISIFLLTSFFLSGCLTTDNQTKTEDTVQAQDPDSAERERIRGIADSYNSALKHFQNKNYDEAEKIVNNEVIAEDKSFYLAYFLRAFINYNQQEYEAAQLDFDSYLYYKDPSQQQWHTEWDKYLERKERQVLLEEADVYLYRGYCSEQLENFEYAVEDFYRAVDTYKELEMDDYISLSYTNVGNNLVDIGSHDEALDAYEKAVEYNPDSYRGQKGLATLNAFFGNDYETIKALSNLLRLDSEQTVSWYEDNLILFSFLGVDLGFFKNLLLSVGVTEENKKYVKQMVEFHGFDTSWFE